MTVNEFVETFKEIIQSEMNMNPATPLDEIEEWDSMGMMALVAYFDAKYGLPITFEQLKAVETVGALAALAPDLKP